MPRRAKSRLTKSLSPGPDRFLITNLPNEKILMRNKIGKLNLKSSWLKFRLDKRLGVQRKEKRRGLQEA